MSTLDAVDRLREIPSADYQYRSRAELQTLREDLRSARDDAYCEMRRITEVAAGCPLTRTQRQDYDAAARRCDEAGALVEQVCVPLMTWLVTVRWWRAAQTKIVAE